MLMTSSISDLTHTAKNQNAYATQCQSSVAAMAAQPCSAFHLIPSLTNRCCHNEANPTHDNPEATTNSLKLHPAKRIPLVASDGDPSKAPSGEETCFHRNYE
jgi:hypothetical protein